MKKIGITMIIVVIIILILLICVNFYITPPVKQQGPCFWGRHVWTTIHSIAAGYEPSMSNAFVSMIDSFTKLLPCPKCREHLKQNLKILPIEPHLKDRHSLFKWSYSLHDKVNKQLGKKSPPFDMMKQYYFQGVGVWR